MSSLHDWIQPKIAQKFSFLLGFVRTKKRNKTQPEVKVNKLWSHTSFTVRLSYRRL